MNIDRNLFYIWESTKNVDFIDYIYDLLYTHIEFRFSQKYEFKR